MSDTPTPDLTAPEQVERLCKAAPFADNNAGIPEMVATLRALSAKLKAAEAERDALQAGRGAIAAHAEPIKGTPYSCGPKAWCDVFDRAARQKGGGG